MEQFRKRKKLNTLNIVLEGVRIKEKAKSQATAEVEDTTERELHVKLDTVKEALPYALDRLKQWRSQAFIKDSIVVTYNGQEEIRNRQGTIEFGFMGFVEKEPEIYHGCIIINMNKGSINKFSSWTPRGRFDKKKDMLSEVGLQPKDKKNTLERFIDLRDQREMKINEWKMDEREAFDIAIKAIGDDKFLKSETCFIKVEGGWGDWHVTVYPKQYSHEHTTVWINHYTKNAIVVR